VLAASGQPAEALPVLRTACRTWHELDAPYDAARVRLLLARVYRSLGDEEAAYREEAAARATFDRLGAADGSAAPDRSDRRSAGGGRTDGLTEREVEVLALVARGHTNRQIATSLAISEKTVARHLANIFTKLGVGSRTEAAGYAFRIGLMDAERHG